MSSWSGVMWILYIFWRSNSCLRYHWQYVFPYRCFSFHFNSVFFTSTVAFYFDKVTFIYSFMSLALGDILVKILLCRISEIFLSMFSSRTFMVSQFIFKSFIHHEFIFVYGVSWCSSFIFFLHVAFQITQQQLMKILFGFHFMFLSPLSNLNWP